MKQKIHMISHTGGVGGKPKPGGVFSFGAALFYSLVGRLNWYYFDKEQLAFTVQDHHGKEVLKKFKEKTYTDHYGFSNECLWFTLHGLWHLATLCWVCLGWCVRCLRQICKVLRDRIKETAPLFFINDYQMALLVKFLRQAFPNAVIAIMWHIPIMGKIPTGQEKLRGAKRKMKVLVDSLCHANSIGVHCVGYAQNLFDFIEQELGATYKVDRVNMTITRRSDGFTARVIVAPLGIDYKFWSNADIKTDAELPVMNENVRLNSIPFFISVGRLEPIKGYLEQLMAIDLFFRLYGNAYDYKGKHYEKGWLGRVSFAMVAAKSRGGLSGYDDYHDTCETMIKMIRNTHKTETWSPIYQLTEAFSPAEVRAFFLRSVGCIIASLADGLNLVAKEYVATNKGKGVLLLSKHAGAHDQLAPFVKSIDPYEIRAMADAILEALHMSKGEKIELAERAHAQVEGDTIDAWLKKWLIESGLMTDSELAA